MYSLLRLVLVIEDVAVYTFLGERTDFICLRDGSLANSAHSSYKAHDLYS